MAVLLLQYVKLIMLFVLIGSVIALSRFGGENRNGSGLAVARRKHSSAIALRIPTVSVRLAAAADGAAFVPNYGPGTEQRPLEPLFG
jgi:hypothetical protein